MTALLIFILFVTIVGLMHHFRPTLDRTDEGHLLMWYSPNGRNNDKRKYLKLYSTRKERFK